MQQLTPDDLKLQKHFGIQAKSLILKKQKKHWLNKVRWLCCRTTDDLHI